MLPQKNWTSHLRAIWYRDQYFQLSVLRQIWIQLCAQLGLSCAPHPRSKNREIRGSTCSDSQILTCTGCASRGQRIVRSPRIPHSKRSHESRRLPVPQTRFPPGAHGFQRLAKRASKPGAFHVQRMFVQNALSMHTLHARPCCSANVYYDHQQFGPILCGGRVKARKRHVLILRLVEDGWDSSRCFDLKTFSWAPMHLQKKGTVSSSSRFQTARFLYDSTDCASGENQLPWMLSCCFRRV